MKIRNIFVCLTSLLLVFSLCSCGKIQEIPDDRTLTHEEMLVEYIDYKESVMKQLKTKINDLDKMDEEAFDIIDDNEKTWFVVLKMDAKKFNLHFDRTFRIEAQKNTIISNDYEEKMIKIAMEEKISDPIYKELVNNEIVSLNKKNENDVSYISFDIYNIENPTQEDYNNINNHFNLYINLSNEYLRTSGTCSDDYFKEIQNGVENILKQNYLKDLKNITTFVVIDSCGQLKYDVVDGNVIVSILRTLSGEEKFKKYQDKDKTEFEKMNDKEKKEFLQEHQSDIDKFIEEAKQNAAEQQKLGLY